MTSLIVSEAGMKWVVEIFKVCAGYALWLRPRSNLDRWCFALFFLNYRSGLTAPLFWPKKTQPINRSSLKSTLFKNLILSFIHLTPTLAGSNIAKSCEWSLWRAFNSNLPYFDSFLIFDREWPWLSLFRTFLLNLRWDNSFVTPK